MKKDYSIGLCELENTPNLKIDMQNIEREITYVLSALAGLGIGAVLFLALIFWGAI